MIYYFMICYNYLDNYICFTCFIKKLYTNIKTSLQVSIQHLLFFDIIYDFIFNK